MFVTIFHIIAFLVTFILFAAAVIVRKKGESRGAKILQMTVRFCYLLILATGFYLFTLVDAGVGYYIKLLLGILTISAMEMILMQMEKGKKAGLYWILFVLLLVFTIFAGMMLPLGYQLPA
jgi:Protein of unknown function (DUF1516).